MRCQSIFAIALVACAACAACASTNGTSTGNPAPRDGGPDGEDSEGDNAGGLATGGYCEAGEMTTLARGEDSPLGFSAADILAFAEGVHEEAIRWNPQNGVTLSPESGEQEVTITVTAQGEPRFVEPKPPGSGNGAGDDLLIDIESNCFSWIEIDVDVTVASSGGALDESFEGVLRAHTPLGASIYASIKPDEIGGELEVDVIAGGPYDGFELGGVQVAVRFSPYSVGGALHGWLKQSVPSDGNEGTATGGGAPYATFGAGTCGENADGFTIGADDAIEGATLQDVLDVFNADDEVDITWEDGEATTSSFAFTPDVQGGCVLLDNETVGDLTLLTEGVLSMTSADGRLAGAWPGRIEGHVENGTVTRVTFLISGKLESHTMPGANAMYGFPNDDISGFDAAGVSTNITVTSAGASGTVTLTGYVYADCDQPPDQPGSEGDADPSDPGAVPPDMGMGTGGCRGADPVIVARGTVQ